MRRLCAWTVGWLVACTPQMEEDLTPQPPAFPEPDAWGGTTGPGAPKVRFEEDDLFASCAFLQGDPTRSADHHNLVVMWDGWLVMPWAPEDGVQRLDWQACGLSGPPTVEDDASARACEGVFGGGLTFYDLSDPCDPVKVGEGWSPWMRESHTLAFQRHEGRDYVAVDYLAYDGTGGVGIWDITDVTEPVWVSQVAVPGHVYPDSYTRLTLSVAWQGPVIYASTALLGTFVIDATDPLDLAVVDQVNFARIHVAGSFHVWGNTAMSSSAGVARTFMVDLSDPWAPETAFGGQFNAQDGQGFDAPYYFANVGSRYGLFAYSPSGGGGPVVYDVSDPSAPTFVSALPNQRGEGGYIFQHEDWLFEGESTWGALYDFSDPTAPVLAGEFALEGDLDTVTPIGSIAVVSVDERGAPGQASAVVPWSAEPDTRGPRPGMTSPADGAVAQPLTSRFGVVFDEMIEPVSVFEGSLRVADEDGWPVAGTFQVAENIVNFTPDELLEPGTTYTVTAAAGGLVDLSGNPMDTAVSWSFTTEGSKPVVAEESP